jgi:hypothetical protein
MPFSYFLEDTDEVVNVSREALERLPITKRTAKILSNTGFMLFDAELPQHESYINMLRELVIAELELERIFKQPRKTFMRDLLRNADTLAAQKRCVVL